MEHRVRRSLSIVVVAAALLGPALLPMPASALPPGAARESRGAQEAAPESEEVDGLTLTEITLARGVEGGQAVDPTNTFSAADGRVVVLLRLGNSTGAETDIRVSFERADREVTASTTAGGVTLHLPARRQTRTVARTGTRAPGRYRVVVRTAAGNVLGTAEYEVTA
jgi:hypothetical protein